MRDPRKNPQAGDILSKFSSRHEVIRTVTDRIGLTVFYANNLGKTFACSLTGWSAWARDATVRTPAEAKAKSIVRA